jgi:hypothetical protein
VAGRKTILFRETQSFRLGYTALTLAVPPAALVVLTLRQMVWHHPWGNPPVSDAGLIFLTLLTSLVYLRLMTVRLVTILRNDRLSVAMRGLVRRTRVPLADIRSAVSVKFDPTAEYVGYGVRNGPRGQAWIASGNQAVQLELTGDRKLLVGSQRPDDLARLISEARAGSTSRPRTELPP